jgi:hypothetical protein
VAWVSKQTDLCKKHARWYEWPSAMLTMLGVSIALAGSCAVRRKRLAARPIVSAWADFFAGRWGGYDGIWASGYRPPDFIHALVPLAEESHQRC